MDFTYDLTTYIGKVRMQLGDTIDAAVTKGAGPKPDGSNVTDEEIAALLVQEGGVMRTVAACCEMLATMWAPKANISVGGEYQESLSDVSVAFAKRAQDLRARFGGASMTFSSGFTRNDGFSTHAAE